MSISRGISSGAGSGGHVNSIQSPAYARAALGPTGNRALAAAAGSDKPLLTRKLTSFSFSSSSRSPKDLDSERDGQGQGKQQGQEQGERQVQVQAVRGTEGMGEEGQVGGKKRQEQRRAVVSGAGRGKEVGGVEGGEGEEEVESRSAGESGGESGLESGIESGLESGIESGSESGNESGSEGASGRGAGSGGNGAVVALRAGKVEEVELHEEAVQSYVSYAMSVIVGRALPDARDGLKPVHRRIL
ncbi:unnamed protein product [Closterium sp. NIES-54]